MEVDAKSADEDVDEGDDEGDGKEGGGEIRKRTRREGESLSPLTLMRKTVLSGCSYFSLLNKK